MPDVDNWGKVKHGLKYLWGTQNLKLTLSIDKVGIMIWYVDASYAVHHDCKGHSGGLLTMGKGAKSSFLQKQKLNTRSSTEAELVGIDDAIAQVFWSFFFGSTRMYCFAECDLSGQ